MTARKVIQMLTMNMRLASLVPTITTTVNSFHVSLTSQTQNKNMYCNQLYAHIWVWSQRVQNHMVLGA